VFVVAHHPEEHDGGEGERCGEATARAARADADFFIDQREERRGYNPSKRQVNMMGSKMKTMSQEYHFSENGQNGRTP